MKSRLLCLAAGWLLVLLACGGEPAPAAVTAATALPPLRKDGLPRVRILRLLPRETPMIAYPRALESLLREVGERTSIPVERDVAIVRDFEDPALFAYPFVYANFAERRNWEFSELEKRQLQQYLERGGFLFVDAGISAEFLRQDPLQALHHSFADWEVHPALAEAFRGVFPGASFAPLKRNHPLFQSFHQGLPDPGILPDTVREYVVQEKWPEGSYSAMGLEVRGRLAVLAMPIIAMGWGKDDAGNWMTTIGFRIREGAPNLEELLAKAAYAGDRYKVRREDGALDTVYCQQGQLPAWVNEPGDRWRLFRYYHSREISEYAHTYYTQLGVNLLVYALTH